MEIKTQSGYQLHSFPKSRIYTFDMHSVARTKNHIQVLAEFDVSRLRKAIMEKRRAGINDSFTANILKCIADSLVEHREMAAFLISKRKSISFDDIIISLMVEKKLGNTKAPIPVILRGVNNKTSQEICQEINIAIKSEIEENTTVISRKPTTGEKLYCHFPGFLRRLLFKMFLKNPRFAFENMGNVLVSSLSGFGSMNAWFIHKSMHPVSFGIGSVVKKPIVINDKIQIREILNMTILLDHDVVDGAPMLRFVKSLRNKIEKF